MVGPMARPGARGLGPGLGLKYEIVLRAGPGLDIIVAGRAGPGPHNSICGPGQVCTTAAGPGRAWASNHVCGPGLGLDFRPVQGPSSDLYDASGLQAIPSPLALAEYRYLTQMNFEPEELPLLRWLNLKQLQSSLLSRCQCFSLGSRQLKCRPFLAAHFELLNSELQVLVQLLILPLSGDSLP